MVTNSTILKLHMEGSNICVEAVSNKAVSNEKEDICIDVFLESQRCDTADKIYILGSTTNAELIHKLYARRIGQSNSSGVYIASPNKVELASVAFAKTDELMIPTSVGGWREVTESDAKNFQLIDLLNKSKFELTAEISCLFRQHPLFSSFLFINNYDIQSALRLINLIIDPRWFIDPAQPDRLARFSSFFGLQKPYINDYFNNTCARLRSKRLKLLTNCWFPHKSENLVSPGNFLYRFFKSRQDPISGLLFANMKLLIFLKETWLDSVAPAGRRLFVPEYFFENEIDAQAFKYHKNNNKTIV